MASAGGNGAIMASLSLYCQRRTSNCYNDAFDHDGALFARIGGVYSAPDPSNHCSGDASPIDAVDIRVFLGNYPYFRTPNSVFVPIIIGTKRVLRVADFDSLQTILSMIVAI